MKQIRIIFSIGILLFLLQKIGFAQNPNDYTFTQAPTDHQLYPRNSNNQATVVFAGNINWSVPYQNVKLRVYSRNYPAAYPSHPSTTITAIPVYINSTTRSFSVSYTISGSLTDYWFQFGYTYNNSFTTVKSITDVVAGDVYIITGQSNSIGGAYWPGDDLPYRDHYSRAYGMYYDDAVRYCDNTNQNNEPAVGGWGEADAYSNPYLTNPVVSFHFAGLTGLQLAKSIIQQNQIPVAIIHGGSGGQEIANFLPNSPVPPYHASSYNLHGFLKQKTINAGVKDNIKALIWYQGESDAIDPAKTTTYSTNFANLFNSWKTDFLNLGPIYMMQLNTFMLPFNNQSPDFGNMNVAKFRDLQRTIDGQYSDVQLIPTVGYYFPERDYDDVHYSVSGYTRNGDLIFKRISKDIYTTSAYTDDEAFAPEIMQIINSGDVISLEFNRKISSLISYTHPITSNTYYLKDYFFNQNDQLLNISSINICEKRIDLILAPNTPIPTKITYLPSGEYNNGTIAGSNRLYVGPWITSSDGLLGAASFYQVPVITPSVVPTNNDRTFVGNVWGDGREELIMMNTSYTNGFVRIDDLQSGTNLAVYNTACNSLAGWLDNNDKSFLARVSSSSRKDLVLVNTDYSGGAIRVEDLSNGSTIHTFPHGTFAAWMDATDKMFVGDINGDDRDELILVNTTYSGGAILTIDLQTGKKISLFNHGSFAGWMDSNDRMLIGDVNGDNHDDLILINSTYTGGAILAIDLLTGANIKLINHGGFSGWLDSGDRLAMGDINGDGKDDLLMINTAYSGGAILVIDVMSGSNLQLINHGTFSGWMDACDPSFVADATGDNKADLILVNTSYSGGVIRVINLQTGANASFINYSGTFNTWMDASDRMLMGETNGLAGEELVMINTSYVNGAVQVFNPINGASLLLVNTNSSPVYNGWMDGTDGNSTNCRNYSSFRIAEEEIISNQEDELLTALIAYPNPSDGIFTLQLDPDYANKETNIEVFDLSGRVIFSQNTNGVAGIITINLSEEANSIYILKVSSADHIEYSKLIKEKTR